MDKSALEQRYMRLLELRVAQLEAIVGKDDGKPESKVGGSLPFEVFKHTDRSPA